MNKRTHERTGMNAIDWYSQVEIESNMAVTHTYTYLTLFIPWVGKLIHFHLLGT